MDKIVISAINFSDGGPLSVMRDCLKYLSENLLDKYEVIALVHDQKLYEDIKGIKYIEFKDSKKSYLKRIYYEYFYFKKLSQKITPYLWLSLHDVTPNVESKIRAVYCHNPMPFYKMNLKEIYFDPKTYLFNLLYIYLYKINITKNDYIVVQQEWIANKFQRLFKIKNTIVAHPEVKKENFNLKKIEKNTKKTTFFYPAFPRVFKNFEIICDIAKELEEDGIKDYLFYLTIDKNMNRYSNYIVKKYKNIDSIKFIGKISRDDIFSYYDIVDALIFPSKLETWGLPITEFKLFNKPIFLSNLDYAHETIGEYDKAIFFNPTDKKELKEKILNFSSKKEKYIKTNKKEKFVDTWHELFETILKKGIKNES